MPERTSSASIQGLHFADILHTTSSHGAYVTVICSFGPGVSDLVTHSPEFGYKHYGIHVGQTDRLTFFGDPGQRITEYFVDCRKGSPTAHNEERFTFNPDPKQVLNIPRGVAHTFDGLENVLTRDEPVWYLSQDNPGYSITNDVINVGRSTPAEDFPLISVNEHPIPREAYDFMLDVQHETLSDMKRYPSRFPITLKGEKYYVSLKPKGASNLEASDYA